MADLEEVSRRSAAAIGRALAAGEASPVALAEHLLDKADAPEARHVYIAVTRERALEQARAAEARLKAGRPASALDGVPTVVKDLIDLGGEITTAASDLRRDAPPARRDAACAAHADAAGMVFLGKANLTEFAYSGLGINPAFGTPRNPHSPQADRVPGGSSSGTGVAIAAGLAPCGFGTDTGGSVRIPAAFNGIVGYKTSEGRIGKQGVFPLSETLDTVGPLGRSVEDCVLFDMAMRGAVASSVRRADPAALAVYVSETVALDDLEPAVAANFEASLKRLAAAGVAVSRGPMPAFADVMRLIAENGPLSAAEAYNTHREMIDGPDAERIYRNVHARFALGKTMTANALLNTQRARPRFQAACRALLGGRLVAMPTVAIAAPETAPLEADDDLYMKTNLLALRNTNLGNMLDLCGLAIPNGNDPDGMPTSFLLSAPGGEDDRLLGAGLALEDIIRG